MPVNKGQIALIWAVAWLLLTATATGTMEQITSDPTGACCMPDGRCFVATPDICDSNGGSYEGDNTYCLGDADSSGADDFRESCCRVRGDADHNGTKADIADLVYWVATMFGSPGPPPPCWEEIDVNDDGYNGDIADLVHMVCYMFQPPSPAPVPCPGEGK